MSADVAVELREDYLYVRLFGEAQLDSIKQHTTQLLEVCAQYHYNKVLVDATALAGLLSVRERYRLGLYFEEVWDIAVRIAVVVSILELPEHEFFEDVAQDREVQVEMFTDEEDALRWLGILV